MADFSEELKKDFLEEAFDLLDKLEENLLTLEKNPQDDKAIQSIFRVAHTIKGGAGTVGFSEIQELTHNLEDALDLARKKTIELNRDHISLLLECRDELAKMLNSRENDSLYDTPERLRLIELLKGVRRSVNTGSAKVEIVKHDTQEAPKPEVKKQTEVHSNINIQKIPLNLTQYDLSLISDFIVNKKVIYLLHYQLNTQYEMRDVSGFQIYALLNDVSEIVKIQPTLQEMETVFYENIYFIITSEKDEVFLKDKTHLKDLVTFFEIQKITQDNFKELEEYGKQVLNYKTKEQQNQSIDESKEVA